MMRHGWVNMGLVIAGGIGQRMGYAIPKQFMAIQGKPLLIHTLERLEYHPRIHGIQVVCLPDWMDRAAAMIRYHGIDKCVGLEPGGESGMASIVIGVRALAEKVEDPAMTAVVIHVANRPILPADILDLALDSCHQHGSGVCALPVVEDPVHTADGITAAYAMDRKQIRRMQTPQVFRLTDLLDAYDEAERRGITDAVSCASLMLTLGRPVYLTPGTEKNLKVTTPDDVDIFRALLQMEQEGTP